MSKEESLSTQMKRKVETPPEPIEELKGNFDTVISTGSTLLDLAISGGRIRGGGLPGGILVEAFGPSGSGKSVLLSSIGGNIQRQGGDLMFYDPEARLDFAFSAMFGLKIKEDNYLTPDTVTEVFEAVRKWKPKGNNVVHGIMTDSLAALSTDSEIEGNDAFGARRAKEMSEQARLTCREIKNKNYLMVASNQVRENIGATMYQPKTKTTGGMAIGFYASVRLQFANPKEIKKEIIFNGVKIQKTIGVETNVKVFKNSIWKPYESAPLTLIFDYGIDDVKENLQFLKDFKKTSTYTLGGEKLAVSIEESIQIIENSGCEDVLKNEVIDLWTLIQEEFKSERKPKLL